MKAHYVALRVAQIAEEFGHSEEFAADCYMYARMLAEIVERGESHYNIPAADAGRMLGLKYGCEPISAERIEKVEEFFVEQQFLETEH